MNHLYMSGLKPDDFPKDCQIRCDAVYSHLEEDARRIKYDVEFDMRMQVAERLIERGIVRRVDKHSTYYSMNLLVFTPDEFMGIVNIVAAKLFHRVPYDIAKGIINK